MRSFPDYNVLEFDANNSNEHANGTDNVAQVMLTTLDLDEEDPKKRPKWWYNTIGDVWVDEMIGG
jgi:hypothetical protein